MFPTTRTPLSTRLRRGVDLAVQFATLGEYGVATEAPAQPQAPLRDPRQLSRAPRRPAAPVAWRPARRAITVEPATAAARRRAEPARRLPTRVVVRSLALSSAPADAQPRPRKRVGQPEPRPQPCVAP